MNPLPFANIDDMVELIDKSTITGASINCGQSLKPAHSQWFIRFLVDTTEDQYRFSIDIHLPSEYAPASHIDWTASGILYATTFPYIDYDGRATQTIGFNSNSVMFRDYTFNAEDVIKVLYKIENDLGQVLDYSDLWAVL